MNESSALHPAAMSVRTQDLLSPVALFRNLWTQRELIRTLTTREVTRRYRGAVLGLAWTVVQPLLMLAVYTLVFTVIFQTRGGAGIPRSEFALRVFCAIILFRVFAECTARAPTLLISRASYVRKMVYPVEVFT